MSSMKANIEATAELLNIDAGALTEYLLTRDPSTADRDQHDRVRGVAVALGMSSTELLLAALDIARAGRAV